MSLERGALEGHKASHISLCAFLSVLAAASFRWRPRRQDTVALSANEGCLKLGLYAYLFKIIVNLCLCDLV